MFRNMFKSFLSLMICQLGKFDAITKRVFRVNPAITICNICRKFLDVIIITVQLPLRILKCWTRRRKITKV